MVDSSFLVALHNQRDAHHARARAALADLVAGRWGSALLPEYVYLEVVTVLLVRRGLSVAAGVGGTLLGARELELVPCSEHFLDAVEVFRRQERTTLSFVDAAIVAIARRRRARYVATFDADFRAIPGLQVVPG